MISMDKYYSYTDFLRAVGQGPQQSECEKLLNDIYLDLFLNRLLRLQRIDQLNELIDRALDEGNEKQFLLYSHQLVELQEVVS